MTPNPTLSDIKGRLKLGKLKEALELFIDWTKADSSVHTSEVELQYSKFQKNERSNREGILTTDEYKAEYNKINKALIDLIAICEKEKEAPAATSKTTLKEHHKYTCDRIPQVRSFIQLKENQEQEKIHFLYLYGGDLHAHKGCVNRIAFSLDGRDKDHIGTRTSQTTLVKSFSFATLEDEEQDKIELIKRLMAEFEVVINVQDALLEKDLSYILDESPSLQQKDGEDNVCVMITISEDDWDKEATPKLVYWFIEHFCKIRLSSNQPSFYFFFAIEYYDDEGEVVDEVEAVIRTASYVRPLPRLDMVSYKDIRRWFNDKYREVEENSVVRRAKLEDNFGKSGDFYMSEIQLKLKKIIDEVNNDNLIK